MSKITNIKILGLALFAVFAFSMSAAASAFAESEWLWQAGVINGELPTHTEGTLKISVLDPASGALLNEIDCSSLFEGTVLAGGVDLVLDVYSLTTPQFVVEELPGKSLDCENLVDENSENACKVSTEAGAETLVWVDELRLPIGGVEELTWETLIELMNGTQFLDHFHKVAFELLCITLSGLDLEALCSGVTSGVLTNAAPGVLLELGEPQGSEALTCDNFIGTTLVAETLADLAGDFTITHEGGGTLAIS